MAQNGYIVYVDFHYLYHRHHDSHLKLYNSISEMNGSTWLYGKHACQSVKINSRKKLKATLIRFI